MSLPNSYVPATITILSTVLSVRAAMSSATVLTVVTSLSCRLRYSTRAVPSAIGSVSTIPNGMLATDVDRPSGELGAVGGRGGLEPRCCLDGYHFGPMRRINRLVVVYGISIQSVQSWLYRFAPLVHKSLGMPAYFYNFMERRLPAMLLVFRFLKTAGMPSWLVFFW